METQDAARRGESERLEAALRGVEERLRSEQRGAVAPLEPRLARLEEQGAHQADTLEVTRRK